MLPKFETVEEFSIDSEIAETTCKIRLRRQTNHQPTRYSPGPYWLDLRVGGVHIPHYCVEEQFAREAATRFLLEYVKGIVPTRH
jgi:hypothetical protein